MQTYDIVLKLLFEKSKLTLSRLTGFTIETWLPIELPRVQNQRVDLLGKANDGTLVQLEFQSSNDPAMALRMAEYSLGVYRLQGSFPRQIVLYVGREAIRMADRLEWHSGSFTYRLIDLREIDSGPLLASPDTSDNVLSILTRFSNRRQTVDEIIEKVLRQEDAGQRAFYLEALLLLAGLRGLEEEVEGEIKKMPVHIDILENKVLGREYKRGHQEGLQEGERLTVRRQIEKRFGGLPDWADEQLAQLSEPDLADLSLRLLDAQTLEELLG